ncbi:MAG: DUF2752 domain-containing protein [Desulfobacteraceae bacterium]|nr:MAG: DUF2752 domain-containing protein [Desulfobacteraceae bacterium]
MKNSRPPTNALFCKRWRPDSFWDVLGFHLPFFLVSGLPLLIAHTIRLNELPLVPCLFIQYSGLPCPFCGYTRSFQAMADGNFVYALNNCPLSCVLYLACLFMFIWNGAAIFSGMRFERGRFLRVILKQRTWFFLLCLVLMNWGYRLMFGLR